MTAQENVYSLLDFATKPLQMAVGGLKLIVFLFVLAVCFVSCMVYGVAYSGPAYRVKTSEFLASQQQHKDIVSYQYRGIGNPTGPLVMSYELQPSKLPMSFDRDEQERYTDVLGNSEWNYENVMGGTDTDDPLQWAEGKETPMYTALLNANHTTNNLRMALLAQGVRNPTLAEAPTVNVDTVQDIYGRDGFGRPYFMNDSIAVNHGLNPAFVVVGMCLPHDCTDEDFKLDTSRDYVGQPSVTPGQGRAIAALDNMASDAFWLKVAHENGVTRDSAILQLAAANRAAMAKPENLRKPAVTIVVIFVFVTIFVVLFLVFEIFVTALFGGRKA